MLKNEGLSGPCVTCGGVRHRRAQFDYSDFGCDMLPCECQFFRDRVLVAGFSVRSGGWCDHGCEAK